jgi:hypothetical protein
MRRRQMWIIILALVSIPEKKREEGRVVANM